MKTYRRNIMVKFLFITYNYLFQKKHHRTECVILSNSKYKKYGVSFFYQLLPAATTACMWVITVTSLFMFRRYFSRIKVSSSQGSLKQVQWFSIQNVIARQSYFRIRTNNIIITRGTPPPPCRALSWQAKVEFKLYSLFSFVTQHGWRLQQRYSG